MKAIGRYENVEIVIPANTAAQKFMIPDQPQLRVTAEGDIAIRAIEAFSVEAISLAPSGNPLASFAQLQNAYLTLYMQGKEGVKWIPLVKLLHLRNASAGFFSQTYGDDFDNLQVDWTKSYISIINGTGGANAAFSIMLGISYQVVAYGALDKIKAAQTL